jgi:hypothetical protein
VLGKAAPVQRIDDVVPHRRVVELRARFRAVPGESLRANSSHLIVKRGEGVVLKSISTMPWVTWRLTEKFVDRCVWVLAEGRARLVSGVWD